MTFNHGVEGSSPSALTKKSLNSNRCSGEQLIADRRDLLG